MTLDDPEDLQQELKDSREKLTKAYNRLIDLLPDLTGEGNRIILSDDPSPPPMLRGEFQISSNRFLAYPILKIQKAIKDIEFELYYINEIIENIFWKREDIEDTNNNFKD